MPILHIFVITGPVQWLEIYSCLSMKILIFPPKILWRSQILCPYIGKNQGWVSFQNHPFQIRQTIAYTLVDEWSVLFLNFKVFRNQVGCEASIWKIYFIQLYVQRLREWSYCEIFYFVFLIGTFKNLSPSF